MERRTFLESLAGVSTVSLAGCIGDDNTGVNEEEGVYDMDAFLSHMESKLRDAGQVTGVGGVTKYGESPWDGRMGSDLQLALDFDEDEYYAESIDTNGDVRVEMYTDGETQYFYTRETGTVASWPVESLVRYVLFPGVPNLIPSVEFNETDPDTRHGHLRIDAETLDENTSPPWYAPHEDVADPEVFNSGVGLLDEQHRIEILSASLLFGEDRKTMAAGIDDLNYGDSDAEDIIPYGGPEWLNEA